ncbi:hypothetical protein ACFQVD_34620 [Streptosporangium amethystogenes subsp. fukuiense]|uniref:Secreted protein n=1 Tax=Streptosporangium amethystogenes subsp. fukuiense TaxID=698418 RepID=A0ABW2T9T7_9ACTN
MTSTSATPSKRFRRILLAVVIGAAFTVAGPISAASATPSECDQSGIPDYYQVVIGASPNLGDRTLQLWNGGGFNYSYARLSPHYSGEQVWVDRSLSGMPSSLPMYPTTEQVNANGGWKQCGPFSSSESSLVMNWNTSQQRHYAVRACARTAILGSFCGNWYIDRT